MNQINNLFYEVNLNREIQISISLPENFNQFNNLNLNHSDDNIDRLRGEYNEISNKYEENNNNLSNNNEKNIFPIINSFQEFQKESYLIVSNIRSINFQIELLYKRQQKQNKKLKIELNVLMNQFNDLVTNDEYQRKYNRKLLSKR